MSTESPYHFDHLLQVSNKSRAPDKLLFGVKYSIIFSKNQLSFKRWGTITQLIDTVPYLFLTSGVNLKTFSVRKACRSLISEIKGVICSDINQILSFSFMSTLGVLGFYNQLNSCFLC